MFILSHKNLVLLQVRISTQCTLSLEAPQTQKLSSLIHPRLTCCLTGFEFWPNIGLNNNSCHHSCQSWWWGASKKVAKLGSNIEYPIQYWKQQEMSTSKRCCTGVVIRCKCFLVSWTLIHPCLRRLLTRLWLSAQLCRTRLVKSVFSRLSLSSASAELTLTFSTAANKSSKTCQDRALAKTSLHSRLRFSCYWSWLWERFARRHPTSQAWHGTAHSIN